MSRIVDGLGRNKLERDLGDYLCGLMALARLRGVVYEPGPLRLAGRTTFRPDYLVLRAGRKARAVYLEAKGVMMEDDAAVKTKVAASLFRDRDFYLVRRAGHGAWFFRPVCPDRGILWHEDHAGVWLDPDPERSV